MKYFVILLVLMAISLSFTNDGFAQIPGNEIIYGNYTNEEFGFSVTLPDSMDGFLTEIDNPSIGKLVNFQIHPEMSDEFCCPSIDSSPIVILFYSHPKTFYSSPVPMANDIHASFQGYRMDVRIENLGKYQVLTSFLDYEREFREFSEPVKRVGKFYFINTGDRYISYGILASEENYKKYIETFENSAKSLTAVNATKINLDELFLTKNFQADLRLEDNSSIFPKITTPSTVTSLIADKSSKSLQINFTEPNDYRSFLAINIGDLLEDPYKITFDGKHAEGQILENESGKYLIVFYSDQGQHDIRISGLSINSISNLPYQIEKINDLLYYVSEPLVLNSDSGRIIFQGVTFRPHIHESPLQTGTFVTFADGTKESFFVGFDKPAFSENMNPQAGFVKRADMYHLLVSVNLKDLSPLKQFKSGILFSEIKCDVNLQLTQRYDETPACVKNETVFELIKRGWTSDMIRLVQSRDVFLDPKDAASSHMDRVTPTLDDFKNVLSEPYDIDEIFSKFGEPHDDIGSGIHIYVYELNDLTKVWVGYADHVLYVRHVDSDGNLLDDLLTRNKNTLRPDDRLEVKHSAGYTTVSVTLSSWDEYHDWEKRRGSEHDAMPPIPVGENNINPIIFDLLNEMWKFEDYEVSKHNKNLFVKTIQKDYGVPNHHEIHDWLKEEHDKAFGESNDGFSSYFEFQDRVYHVTMLAAD